MLELIAGILLAAGAVYFVLRPIFRPEMTGNGDRETGNVSDGEDPDDDFSSRAVALRALKEIEFDRATGKLSDADYDALKTKYTTEALAALRTEQPRSEMRDAGGVASAAASHPASRIPHPVCPSHGPRSETDALFCSECGRRLATAPGYCARCGTALEHDAHYCHSCGARVAA
ncbi:MAG TPA: zinc-ribbon domain-containing protein [Gemmatimonadales bacterium]|nr:zinc-ribbon domain-containing protein [Gemmatimonadales bacterium]